MNDVKIEAVAWQYRNGKRWETVRKDTFDRFTSKYERRELYDHATILALQELIAELTNANLRMLGERDRARIAEAEVARLRALIDGAATGEVVGVGDDESGQPRVLVHSTRDELRKGAALAFRKVCIVPIGKALAGEP